MSANLRPDAVPDQLLPLDPPGGGFRLEDFEDVQISTPGWLVRSQSCAPRPSAG